MKARLLFITLFLCYFLLSCQNVLADTWITTNSSTLDFLRIQNLDEDLTPTDYILGNYISAIRLSESGAEKLAFILKSQSAQLGGFIVHSSYEEAQKAMYEAEQKIWSDYVSIIPYTIDQDKIVTPLIAQVNEADITATIAKLSSYETRYHKSDSGKESQLWLADYWGSLTKGRKDISIEVVTHKKTPQPSIILTVSGTKYPNEIVVVGGHGDSMPGGIWGRMGSGPAPGADDNASGIATITEVIRLIVANDLTPNRTIKFISYAAEEVGLVGSGEIASNYKKNKQNVIGALQLDMVNYRGSALEMYLVNDYTSSAQNNFLGKLIDYYLKFTWGTIKCGYGCSDHASWNAAGFPASVPFESTMDEYNPNIHSKKDTLDVTNGHSYNAVKFAKLALAYTIELAKFNFSR
ncbi:MAG: hypothetical protein A2504_09245 [Bdellovibrionales bacterium RIFOXYD12_FULL_39_22]|nr:MAG: hypothetical protein A2385_17305 [Bdellovibrionales bacterium RIFOXYB1_FULL_39_21]OFZ41074.1 MAG: hypothetical protein A2485_00230 [Bdellovibrionales bacterium RIFOXYC12_FULL_39_17]OFZ50287.1 MAG: hypothetical protein A2404_07545 [Bdellovibrionales bacterium RIFOXYC1_FULL_39_130]OFZ75088.1 MAG: hypothetical protein A2560_16240 [Bdellovibrionales bacterium RIFOXYD1_FULL_39_84]OFZ92270.1 MAG: hypothetical protein A2504_09245 [Bdellovibrionales bacterium RIFOXYD12_FULL_39_22]HLE10927.1 M2